MAHTRGGSPPSCSIHTLVSHYFPSPVAVCVPHLTPLPSARLPGRHCQDAGKEGPGEGFHHGQWMGKATSEHYRAKNSKA